MTTHTYPATFEDAAAFLMAGRNVNSRPIENNTRLERRSEGVAIKLHDTDVVTLLPNGQVRLDSGGWLTVTTKDRINRALGAIFTMRTDTQVTMSIWSTRGRWSLHKSEPDPSAEPDAYGYRSRIYTDLGRFFDGMVIDIATATVVNPRPDLEQLTKREIEQEKRLKRYIDGFIRALEKGIPMPSGGDCWGCALYVVDEGPDKGKPAGDIGFVADHIEQHMKDRYYVPSLLVNAFRERGFGDFRFVMAVYFDYAMLQAGTGIKLNPGMYIGRREVRRVLRRYLKPRVLPTLAR